tara:strand:- start:467 stop:667 length:201 start_codon:yes stop_codon:yes gene_type:complete
MNQEQFVEEVMTVLFGDEYEFMAEEDCSYELALGMIKQKYEQKKVYSRRPSLRETQAMQARNRGGY